MASWGRVQGDQNDTITVGLPSVDSLADVDVIVVLATLDDLTEPMDGTVLHPDGVTDEYDRLMEPPSFVVALTPWLDDAAPGQWVLDYTVTWLDGTVRTFPESDDRDFITVRAKGQG